MARTTQSSKVRGKVSRKAFSGGNGLLELALAGFSATGGGNTANFTPNDEGLIPAGEQAPREVYEGWIERAL